MAERSGTVRLEEVRAGFWVLTTDGYVGRVTEVLIGAPTEGSYLCVRLFGRFGKELYVPATHVRSVSEPHVRLALPKRDIETVASAMRPRPFSATS